jgi:hypothetical protein
MKIKPVIDSELNLIHKEQFCVLFDQHFFGCVKIALFLCLMDPYNTGKRPMISGINPKSLISLGMMYCSKLSLSILSTF